MTSLSPARSPAPALMAAPLVLALAAIAVGYGQMALGLGLSPQAFSRPGDATLRAAPYAFAIWGLIYSGLLAMGVFEVLPAGRRSGIARTLLWPSIGALAGITAWVMAAAADLRWLTVALIAASCALVVTPLVRAREQLSGAGRGERWLVIWPLALLAGWLTAASVLNALNVLTSEGLIQPGTNLIWAWGGILVATVFSAVITLVSRQWIYAAPVSWGLIGIFVAERSDGDLATAWPALGGAIILALTGVVVLLRRSKAGGH